VVNRLGANLIPGAIEQVEGRLLAVPRRNRRPAAAPEPAGSGCRTAAAPFDRHGAAEPLDEAAPAYAAGLCGFGWSGPGNIPANSVGVTSLHDHGTGSPHQRTRRHPVGGTMPGLYRRPPISVGRSNVSITSLRSDRTRAWRRARDPRRVRVPAQRMASVEIPPRLERQGSPMRGCARRLSAHETASHVTSPQLCGAGGDLSVAEISFMGLTLGGLRAHQFGRAARRRVPALRRTTRLSH